MSSSSNTFLTPSGIFNDVARSLNFDRQGVDLPSLLTGDGSEDAGSSRTVIASSVYSRLFRRRAHPMQCWPCTPHVGSWPAICYRPAAAWPSQDARHPEMGQGCNRSRCFRPSVGSLPRLCLRLMCSQTTFVAAGGYDLAPASPSSLVSCCDHRSRIPDLQSRSPTTASWRCPRFWDR